ncbi:MAG: aminotransferase class V-fold PLP-dependent enzyme [Rhizobiales bacterium]|nr:aminotransferase class V-fold PLP-dependent enzyme [Hyphomicrobiales bacterium]
MTRAYLDHNATTPMRPEAAQAVMRALEITGNPSSVHGEGRAARKIVETARRDVAALVNADPAQLTFTSGGTESNHLALHSAKAMGVTRIIMSAIEHEAMFAPAHELGLPVLLIPVDANGVVRLDALATLLGEDEGRALVVLMLAQNETGVIQPVAEAAHMAHEAGGLMLTDAVQAVGKIPVDMHALDVDMMTLGGHKIGAPMGVGALIMREGLVPSAMFTGGGQEKRHRAGSVNLPGIAGFGAAALVARREVEHAASLAVFRDEFEEGIEWACPDVVIFGKDAPRLPNTSYFAAKGPESEMQLMALDLEGIAVSAGAACSSGKVGRSRVLEAMGVQDEIARSAIRMSLGWTSTRDDIEKLLAAWSQIQNRAAARQNLNKMEGQASTPHPMSQVAEAGR